MPIRAVLASLTLAAALTVGSAVPATAVATGDTRCAATVSRATAATPGAVRITGTPAKRAVVLFHRSGDNRAKFATLTASGRATVAIRSTYWRASMVTVTVDDRPCTVR